MVEEFIVFAYIVTLLVLATELATLLAKNSKYFTSVPTHKACEQEVSFALRSMDTRSYVVFDNLVLRSGGNTPHTEIDHVVVSPYGIFCIETKSHHSSVYGYRNSKKWKQYLGGKEYDFYNPYRQSYKHTEALRALLSENLRAPIHSYVVFPNAQSVKIDGQPVNATIQEVVRKIENHTQQVYNLHDCERILKTLAYASSNHEELLSSHVAEVNLYLQNGEPLQSN